VGGTARVASRRGVDRPGLDLARPGRWRRRRETSRPAIGRRVPSDGSPPGRRRRPAAKRPGITMAARHPYLKGSRRRLQWFRTGLDMWT